MSGEQYSIFIKVDATQVNRATEELKRLAVISDVSEISIKKLGNATKVQGEYASKLEYSLAKLARETTTLSGAMDAATASTKKASGALDSADNSSRKVSVALDTLNRVAKSVHSTFVLFIGIELARFLREQTMNVGKAADAYTNMKSQLDLATNSQDELNKAFKESTVIANKYYANVTDIATAYAKFNPIIVSMGRSASDTTKVVSALSASLAISGRNAVDTSETYRQFSQAISGPNIQMEEMNTIIDSNQALWRGLQRQLPDVIAKYGSLKEAISKNAVTSKMLLDATIALGPEFEELAARKVPTMSNALTVLSNNFTMYIGEADKASGASTELATLILDLSEALKGSANDANNLGIFVGVLTQAFAGGRGIIQGYMEDLRSWGDLLTKISQLGDLMPGFAGTPVDPQVEAIIKQGQGQVPISELARGKPTTAPKVNPPVAAVDSKKAAKEATDAMAAFKAMVDAQISAGENAEKIFAAMADTRKKRYEIEADQIKGLAELKIRSTKSEAMRLAITEEAQGKIVESISRETDIRQSALDKEMETLQIKLGAVQQEMDAADAHKLKQAERIELTTKQAELEAELVVKRQERTQIELDAIGQIQSAEMDLAEARVQANEAMVKEEALRQLEIMSSNLEYAKEMATGLAEAFGEVGAAIGGMSVAMAEYDKQSATIEIARKEAVDKAEGDQKRITEINDDAAKKQSKAEIKKYGDMAQAAQGFFKKNTAGYKAMETVTKTFRAFEIAQSALSAAKQLSDTAQVVGSAIAAIFTETAANTASVAPNVAADSAKAAAAGTDAVAKAAAAPFPIGFVTGAAMLAFMVAIGAMSGGGGAGSAPAIPEAPTGSGTVKGDPMAQSESISKSLAILEENSSNDLNYSAGMLEALLDIKSALGGVEKQIANTLTPAISDLTMKYGTDAVKQAGFLFRDQKLSKILATGRVEGFIGARVETESEDGIKKGQTLLAAYGPKFAKAFGATVGAVVTSIEEAAKSIGISEGEIGERLKNFVVSLGKINIAGMTAEEAAKQVEAAISAMSDSMAEQALPEFKDFQQSGEGYKETIVRVAEGIQRATGNLELLGMEAINYTEITDKQKDVAAEITRQTIMAQGDLSEGTREYVKELTGSSEEIIASYKQILSITNLMRGAGFGTEDIDRTMINAAGGLAAFEESLQSFRENFMTDEQRVAADTEELTKAFGKLGYAMPKTKDEFYAIAMGMDRSTEEGKKLFAQFMGLNEKFSDLTDASQELADAQAEAAQAASDAAKKAQEDLIAGLQKTVDTALSDMKKAYQDLEKVQDRFIKLSQNLKNYLDDITGAASPYTSPEERYRIAKAEFQRVAELARSGNEEALGSLATASKDLLATSKEYNASSEQFQADFASVTQAIQDSMAYTQSQVDLAAKQLAYAEASYGALATLNGSVISVAQGIAALNSSMASYTSAVAALAKANIPTAPGYTAPTAPGTPSNPIPVAKPTPVAPIQSLPFIPGGAAGSNYFANNNRYKYSKIDAENIIRFYYQQLLGRYVESDAALNGWAGQLISGSKTTNEIAQMFKEGAEYRELVGRGFVPGFAKGGMAYPGLALVGEQGPELVSFGTQAHVSTASQTQGFFSGLQASIEKGDADQTNELQALVRLQSAANQQLIKEMKELKGEMAELARKAKIEAAA